MHPVILICDSPFSKSDPLVKALKNIGVEARETTFEEIKGEDLTISEATVIAIKTPDSYVLTVSGRRNREGLLRRAALALVSSGCLVHARPTELPEIPEPPKLADMKAVFNEEFIFEKPKPNWPKPNHVRPTAQWKHRPAASHPARSRDKRFMR